MLLPCLALLGCAGLPGFDGEADCSPEAARSTAKRDAHSGRAPRSSYGAHCGPGRVYLYEVYIDAYERARTRERARKSSGSG